MFRKKKDNLEQEIDRLVVKLSSISPDDVSYAEVAKNLETLIQVRNNKPGTIKGEQWLAVGGMIAQTVLMLNFERLHVISSKVVSFLWKGRLS